MHRLLFAVDFHFRTPTPCRIAERKPHCLQRNFLYGEAGGLRFRETGVLTQCQPFLFPGKARGDEQVDKHAVVIVEID